MNSLGLAGRIANEPVVKEFSGTKFQVLEFKLAVRRGWKDSQGNDTDFIWCKVKGKNVDKLGRKMDKGMFIGVGGSMRVDQVKKGSNYNEYIYCDVDDVSIGWDRKDR